MSLKEHPTTDREDTASLDAQIDKLGSGVLGRARVEARRGVESLEDEDHPRRKGSSMKKRTRPTGRPRVEVSGRDVARMIANEEDKKPDPLTPEERREIAKKGRAAARAALDEDRKQPTAEEIAAARRANAEKLLREAKESWGNQV